MAKVALPSTAETRAQILQLIALEKLENDKDYTIKSYLEMLVGLAARGKFDQAVNPKVEVKREPVTLRADSSQLLAALEGSDIEWPNAKPYQFTGAPVIEEVSLLQYLSYLTGIPEEQIKFVVTVDRNGYAGIKKNE
jgi:hypothetical protein